MLTAEYAKTEPQKGNSTRKQIEPQNKSAIQRYKAGRIRKSKKTTTASAKTTAISKTE